MLYDFLNGPNQVSFCLFLLFSHGKYSTNIINDKIANKLVNKQQTHTCIINYLLIIFKFIREDRES